MGKHLNFYRTTRPNMTEADFERTESVISDVWDMFKEKKLTPIEQLEVLENCTAFVKGETWWVDPTDKEANMNERVEWLKLQEKKDFYKQLEEEKRAVQRTALISWIALGISILALLYRIVMIFLK